MITKKPVLLTLNFELVKKLKRRRVNLSKYVEKLLINDVMKCDRIVTGGKQFSSPSAPSTFIQISS